MDIESLPPAVLKAACQAFAAKSLVEGDLVLHSACLEVSEHPERLMKLLDMSPAFVRELERQKERYERRHPLPLN